MIIQSLVINPCAVKIFTTSKFLQRESAVYVRLEKRKCKWQQVQTRKCDGWLSKKQRNLVSTVRKAVVVAHRDFLAFLLWHIVYSSVSYKLAFVFTCFFLFFFYNRLIRRNYYIQNKHSSRVLLIVSQSALFTGFWRAVVWQPFTVGYLWDLKLRWCGWVKTFLERLNTECSSQSSPEHLA